MNFILAYYFGFFCPIIVKFEIVYKIFFYRFISFINVILKT